MNPLPLGDHGSQPAKDLQHGRQAVDAHPSSWSLVQPRFAGLTVNRGAIVGKGAWPGHSPADGQRPAARTFQQPRQAKPRRVLAKHLDRPPALRSMRRKMVATCVSPATERRRYACPPPGRGCGHLSVGASHVEASAYEAIVLRVASPEVQARPVRASVRDRRWVKAEAELRRSRLLLDALATDLAEGRITRREWLPMRPEIAERIAKSTAVVMQDRYDAGIAEFIGNPGHLTELWQGMHASAPHRDARLDRPDHCQASSRRSAPLRSRPRDRALAQRWSVSTVAVVTCAPRHQRDVPCARLQPTLQKSRGFMSDALRALAEVGERGRCEPRCKSLVPRPSLQGNGMRG